MKKVGKYFILLMILSGLIISSCRTRRDCGGRKKVKIKTNMGGYM